MYIIMNLITLLDFMSDIIILLIIFFNIFVGRFRKINIVVGQNQTGGSSQK